MDPTRSPHIISRIPPDKVALVARELARQGEWVVIGGFVSTVSDVGLRASIEVFTGEQLLRIGFVLDDTARLSEVAEMLTDGQLDELLVAAAEHELWPELDEFVSNLAEDEGRRLGERLRHGPERARAAVAAAAAAGKLRSASAAQLDL